MESKIKIFLGEGRDALHYSSNKEACSALLENGISDFLLEEDGKLLKVAIGRLMFNSRAVSFVEKNNNSNTYVIKSCAGRPYAVENIIEAGYDKIWSPDGVAIFNKKFRPLSCMIYGPEGEIKAPSMMSVPSLIGYALTQKADVVSYDVQKKQERFYTAIGDYQGRNFGLWFGDIMTNYEPFARVKSKKYPYGIIIEALLNPMMMRDFMLM